MIAQITPARHRSAALTLWGTFFGVAFAIVAWFGLPLVSAFGLQALFAAHAAAMLVIASILFVMLPRIESAGRDSSKLDVREIWRRHVTTYGSAFMSAPALGWLFYTLSFVSILTVVPAYIDPASRTFAVGVMPLAGIATSMTPVSCSCIHPRHRRHPARLCAVSVRRPAAMAISGNPWVCIGLLPSLGLVQGASFAAIPQLNSDAQSPPTPMARWRKWAISAT